MTPLTKETPKLENPGGESLAEQSNAPKPSINQTGSDAVSLEVPVRVHGSRVTEVVRGITPHTEPFEEETTTMIVFAHGGVLRMSTNVGSGQMLVITNIKTGQDAICRVVKVRTYTNMASYVEVEFTHALPGYWGVHFGSDDEPAKPVFPVGSPISGLPEPREKKGPEPSLPLHPLVKAPLPKGPDAGMFPSEAPKGNPPAQVPPASAIRKEIETTFISIGSQEKVQPAATETVFKRKYSVSKDDALSLPVSTPPSPRKADTYLPSHAPSGLQIVPTASLPVTAPVTPEFAPVSEVFSPRESQTEMQSTSANISPVFAPRTESLSRPGEKEKLLIRTEELSESTHTSTAAAPVAEDHAPVRPAPREMFGTRLAVAEGSLAGEGAESGKKWILIAAVAAVAVLGVGGFFYFHLNSAPVDSVSSAPAAPAENDHVAPSTPEGAENPVPPASSKAASAASTNAPARNESVPSLAAPSTRSSVENSRENRKEAAKETPSAPAAPAPGTPSQAGTSSNKVPASVTSSLFGTLNAHPVAKRGESHLEDAAPSVGIQPPPPSAPLANDAVLGIGGSAAPVAPAPLKVGGKIISARVLSSVPPVYPSVARQMRVQGDVILKINIDPSGNVSKAEVVSGPQILQQSALDAVKRWKFQPAQLDGQPTDSQTVVTITFRI